MPSTDEDYGSARITLELDDSGATREAASVGADIERALTRATRNIGTRIRQTIERGMRRTTVAVEPDLRQFERQLRTGMRSLNPVMVPVTADLRQFQRSMRSSGTQPINVPVTPDVTRFARTLTRALRGVQAEVQVRADARRMIQDIERELRRVSPPAISVRAEADVSRIRSQLNSLDPPTIEVTLSLDVDRIEEQLRELADREIHIPIGIGPAGAAGAAGATAGASVLGGLTSSLMAAGPWGAVVAAAAAYAAMIGKTLMAGIEGVIEQQRLTGALKASLGLGAQEAAAVGRVVGQLYARGVVESVEEGTSAVQAAIRNGLAAPDDIGLESLATQISDVGRLMEEDVGQVARAVGLMVKTGLVDNATEGLDLLTAGVQGGANAAEDLLELFSEYSTQFRQLGLSGQEAMGLIQQGLQGGARDADTIADAFKEFSIEAAAGGERVVDAFKAMDLDADRLSSAFAKGGPAAREALTEVLDSLRSIEDPLERNQVAIGLFGTKAEDLAGALQAIDLDTAAAEMDGFAGATKRAGDDLRNNLGDKLQTVFRETKQAFQALFTGDTTQFADVGNAVRDALPLLKETGQKVVTSILEGIEEYGPKIFDKLFDLASSIGERVDIWGPLLLKLGAAVSVLPAVLYGLLFTAIGGLLSGMGQKLWPYLEEAWDSVAAFFTDTIPEWAKGVGQQLLDGLAGAFDSAKQGVSSGIDSVVGFFTGLPGKIGASLGSLGSTIGQFFTDGFEWAKQAVSDGIDSIIEFFASLPGRLVEGLSLLGSLLVDAFTSAIAFAIIGVLSAIAGLTYVFTELPGQIVAGLAQLGAFLLMAFQTGLDTAKSWLSTALDETVAWFAALPGRVVAGLSQFGALVLGALSVGWSQVQLWVTTALDSTIAWFAALPSRIGQALLGLGAQLLGVFMGAFTSVNTTVSGWITNVITFFAGLPGRAKAAIAALPGQIGSVFATARERATSAASSLVSSAVSFLRDLPGKAGDAVSSIKDKIAGAFNTARERAIGAVNTMISRIVGLFSGLGGKIVDSLGDIGSQIVGKVKSGLPSSVRNLLPFGNGGIVNRPTAALIGEAGPEVVIPLSRPQRARQLAEQSGLLELLGAVSGAVPAPAGPAPVTHTHHWTLTEVGDASVTAQRVINRLAHSAVL